MASIFSVGWPGKRTSLSLSSSLSGLSSFSSSSSSLADQNASHNFPSRSIFKVWRRKGWGPDIYGAVAGGGGGGDGSDGPFPFVAMPSLSPRDCEFCALGSPQPESRAVPPPPRHKSPSFYATAQLGFQGDFCWLGLLCPRLRPRAKSFSVEGSSSCSSSFFPHPCTMTPLVQKEGERVDVV